MQHTPVTYLQVLDYLPDQKIYIVNARISQPHRQPDSMGHSCNSCNSCCQIVYLPEYLFYSLTMKITPKGNNADQEAPCNGINANSIHENMQIVKEEQDVADLQKTILKNPPFSIQQENNQHNIIDQDQSNLLSKINEQKMEQEESSSNELEPAKKPLLDFDSLFLQDKTIHKEWVKRIRGLYKKFHAVKVRTRLKVN